MKTNPKSQTDQITREFLTLKSVRLVRNHPMTQARPEFDLDPREIENIYTKEYRRTRLARFEAAKQIYQELSQEHLDEYRRWMDRRDQAPIKCPQTKQELEERHREIELLEQRLQCHRDGLGDAHRRAQDEYLEEQKRRAEEQILNAQRRELEAERFKAALKEEQKKESYGKLIIKKRKRFNRAKRMAIGRENMALDNFRKAKEEKKEKEKQRAILQRQKEEVVIQKPPMDAFPGKVKIPEVGELPVNPGALEYQKTLETAREVKKEARVRRRLDNVERTKQAAYRMRCHRVRNELQADVDKIHKFEIAQRMDRENLMKPASEIPMISTYLVEEKDRKRNEYIQMFLSAPDPPKPRRVAPQPIPVHQTSPNVSEDENEEEENPDE